MSRIRVCLIDRRRYSTYRDVVLFYCYHVQHCLFVFYLVCGLVIIVLMLYSIMGYYIHQSVVYRPIITSPILGHFSEPEIFNSSEVKRFFGVAKSLSRPYLPPSIHCNIIFKGIKPYPGTRVRDAFKLLSHG